jgi:dipeptidyl aminopeptidase/acylaminoacyl peptidase
MKIRALWAAVLLLVFADAPAPAQVQTAVAPREPLPMSAFARLPETERPRINTDGTALAAKIRANGEQVLAIIPLDQPNARPIVIARDGEFDQRDDVRTTNWEWIDADNLLIWISSRTDLDGQKVDATRVIAYNRTTRQTTRLGWEGTFVFGSDVLWRSRSGPPRILLGRLAAGRGYERLGNEEVIEVDVTTGRTRLITAPRRGVEEWYADGEGNLRLGTSFDRNTGHFQALYRPDGASVFRTIVSDRMQRFRDPPVPIAFLPDEKALVVSRHEGFRAIYEMDLRTMEIGRKVFGVDGYDIDPGGIRLNAERSGLEGVLVTRDRDEYEWMNPRLREIQSVLDETFGAHNARIVSADRPRENIVVHVGAPDQAGGYYLYQTTTGSMRLIGWMNTALRDMHLNPVRTVRYRASDGQTIAAVLTLPRLREHRNLPVIVMPHGGPWARDAEDWDPFGWAQAMAELGYAVIQPNYRGSSGYGQTWEAMSDGNWGTRMQDDLNDAVDYLAHEGIADAHRACIMGWSYGGYAASRAAQRDGSRWRCAISGAGVHDLPDMVAFDRDYLGRYGSQYIGSAASRLADVSPGRHPEQYSAPILIVHGARDQRVPVSQSRNLVDRLRRAGKVEGRDFVYVEQPRNTHNLPLEADRLQFLEEARRFLAAHNPA